MCTDDIARMYEGITLEEGINHTDIARLQQIQEEEEAKNQTPTEDTEK